MVTGISQSIASGDAVILIIIDQLTHIIQYLLCQKIVDLLELAKLIFEHDMWKFRIPDILITDYGTKFTRLFGTQVWSHLSSSHQCLMAFHLQTDGQTVCLTQMIEQYPWAICNLQQDNSVLLLLLAIFTYNRITDTSRRMTPFWPNYHYITDMQ